MKRLVICCLVAFFLSTILYADENIDFVDAYNGVWMQEQGLSSAITFDTKHFQRIPGIVTHTPTDLDRES